MVLLAVIRLKEDAYGVAIAHEIEAATGREAVLGSVYAALDRLEQRRLVTSTLGEATAERGGKAKRYFQVTAAGLREVHAARQALTALWRGVPKLAGAMG
jgi:PadR family transcriptional regulator